jgi:hypothetical protein
MSKKVSDILDDMAALSDDDTELLLSALDHGMWDEWDTSLVGGLSIGFGPVEVRVAVKSAASFVKYLESKDK